MQSERASALHGLLALVAGHERVEGRVRLQKEAYLLALKGYSRFGLKHFCFHYYGPYSQDVTDALHFGVASGLIDERREDFPGRQRYSYVLTEDGREWLESESDEIDKLVQKYFDALSKANWRTLELAASCVFLERSEELKNRKEAFSRALSLKPDCEPYEQEAVKLLDELAI